MVAVPPATMEIKLSSNWQEEQLQSSEKEKVTVQQQLTRAEEAIRREQQHIQDMKQKVNLCACVHVCV